MRSPLFLASLFLLLAGARAGAQTETWRVYTTTNSGLPDDNVYALAVHDTVAWIGTANGLARFDGATWSVYDTTNTPLRDAHITALAVDRDGAVWAGTVRGGVVRFDGSIWNVYDTASSALRNNTIHGIAIDSAGRPWVTTDSGMAMFRADGDWDIYTEDNSGIGHAHARGIAIASDGTKWLGVFNYFNFIGRLISFDDNGDQWAYYRLDEAGMISASPDAIAVDRHGVQWIGTTGGGLGRFENGMWTVYNLANSGIPSNGVLDVALEGDAKWLGTGGGLARFDDAVWTVYRTTNSGLPDNAVYAVAIDGSGDTWAGTGGGGVAVLHREAASDVPADRPASAGMMLMESHPQPVAASATISYRLDAPAHVRLTLHDMQGRRIATLAQEAQGSGLHDVTLDASSLPAGVYLCRLVAGRKSLSRTIVVAR